MHSGPFSRSLQPPLERWLDPDAQPQAAEQPMQPLNLQRLHSDPHQPPIVEQSKHPVNSRAVPLAAGADRPKPQRLMSTRAVKYMFGSSLAANDSTRAVSL